MKKLFHSFRNSVGQLLFFALFGIAGAQMRGVEENPVLGPQSKMAKGELQVLVAAVRFPDVEPRFPLERIRRKAVEELDQYLREQSYGLAWLKADFRGWLRLPDPISEYKVSPYNYKVDRTRVRKLIEDTMTALEEEINFSQYQHMLIIPGAFTMPGKGYGMICYSANPGVLTGVKRYPHYVTLRSRIGKEFQGGVFVGTENAHLGMFAHDFFHALGGIYGNKRMVPCLYDFDRQSDPSRLPSPEHHAIYMGPWDIMSAHFVKRDQPPPGISSFTKIRLGWISAQQAVLVKPGDTAHAFLYPLSQKGDVLTVKIPLTGSQYYLVENRQPLGFDRTLPDSGLLILKVNPEAVEGSGTVQIMNANPKANHFSQATFKLGLENRNLFLDKRNNLAILPLWSGGDKQGVLVTTGERSEEALNAALMVQRLLWRYPEPPGREEKQLIDNCIALFKRYDFKTCAQIAQKGLKE